MICSKSICPDCRGQSQQLSIYLHSLLFQISLLQPLSYSQAPQPNIHRFPSLTIVSIFVCLQMISKTLLCTHIPCYTLVRVATVQSFYGWIENRISNVSLWIPPQLLFPSKCLHEKVIQIHYLHTVNFIWVPSFPCTAAIDTIRSVILVAQYSQHILALLNFRHVDHWKCGVKLFFSFLPYLLLLQDHCNLAQHGN